MALPMQAPSGHPSITLQALALDLTKVLPKKKLYIIKKNCNP
jgi:hypothetical protein